MKTLKPSSEVLSQAEVAAREIAAVTGAHDKYNADRDLVNQILGQAQAFSAAGDLLRTFGISKLAYVKENKLYKGLEGMLIPNRSEKLGGTWEEFCGLLGQSVDKVDLDIKNLRTFGEEALESMSKMGIGYRDLRQYRRLPGDAQTALIEAAKSGDKEQFLDLAEELIARQAKEKEELEKQRLDLQETIAAKDERSAERERKIEKLQRDLSKAKRERAEATPDEIAMQLRDACSKAVMAVRAELSGVDKTFAELAAHGVETESNNSAFLAGLVHELLTDVQLIRDGLGLPILGEE